MGLSSEELLAGDLLYLVGRAKASIGIEINRHLDFYQSAAEWLAEQRERDPDGELDCSPYIEAEMARRNQVVEVTVFPDTPNGHYTVLHWDLGGALHEMAETIRGQDRDEGRPVPKG